MKKHTYLASIFAAIVSSIAIADISTDYDASLAKAKAASKPLLVLFTGSDWCIWCQRLEKEVTSQTEFLDFATNDYEYVVLDFPSDSSKQKPSEIKRNGELQEKFAVQGFPSMLAIDSATEEVLFTTGYVRGGAAKWVESFKRDAALAPIRKKYLNPIEKEILDFSHKFMKAANEIGKPTKLETAEKIKDLFDKGAKKMEELKARLDALDIPKELEEDKAALAQYVKEGLMSLREIADKKVEELLAE